MSKMKKMAIVTLILLNSIVLLGQLWPAGAPPFARLVNVGFLILSLFSFIGSLLQRRSKS